VDPLLELGIVEILDDGSHPVLATLLRPDRVPPEEVLRNAGVTRAGLESAPPAAEVLARAAAEIDGARLVSFASIRPGTVLGRAVAATGRPERPADVIALAPALRRAGRLPPRGDLEAAAEALGVTVTESGRSGDLAAITARLTAAARGQGIDLLPPERPGFDFTGREFGPETLAEIPARPGIYRFFDSEGRLLYVGKAKDLRARVGSYFAHREKRRRRHAELVSRTTRIEWEETGSELRALLAEATEIRTAGPELNVAVEVHRRRDAGGDLVLFLPGEVEGAVDLLFVRDGAPAGRATSDRRARGMREVRAALRRAFFSDAPPEASAADAQIVASWLRSEGERVNALDLSEVAGIAEAARRVKAYLTDPDLFTRKVWHR
jgi:hypothetical protein